jgi:hypothetical protein
MQQLSSTDQEFFSDWHNWSTGPMYQVHMYFQPGTELDIIERAIFATGNPIHWPGAGPRFVKSILRIEGLPSVGLVHNPITYNAFPTYCLSIYPPQYKRALGANIQTRTGENWTSIAPSKIKLFHEALFHLIREVNAQVPIISASINTEDVGMMAPYTSDGSICISPNLVPILEMKATELTDSFGFFAITL